MLPYFYPPEYFSYNKQFPHDYSTAMFPYDKEKDPRFVELLNIAMQRNKPLTKDELVEEYGEEIYDRRMHPEKYGFASLREEKLFSFFSRLDEKNLVGKENLFKEYSRIILAVIEKRRQTKCRGLHFSDKLMQYITIAPFFEWEEDDRVIFSYVYPGIVTAKLDERYSVIGVEGTGIRMHTKKLVRYANYGKSVLF